MSKYGSRGSRDDGRDAFNSRMKSSNEPVLGSSINPGRSEDCQFSHEASKKEKDSYRKQEGRGGSRTSANDLNSHPSRLHHREDEPKGSSGKSSNNADGNIGKHGSGKYALNTEKRRSQSPDSRKNAMGHDDSHKSGRSSAGRNHDANHQDRRSPGKKRDRRRSRSRSRDKRRSRSRSLERHRSRSRERERRRPRSRIRDRRKSRSKERKFSKRSRSRDRMRHISRSQSKTPDYCRPRPLVATTTVNKPVIKVDDGKMETEKKVTDTLSKEKPSNLPLNDLSQLTRSGMMTPQMAVQQAMAAMNARAQQLTGVTLPKYYNPAAVNPLKYAEQMQKRKLLWQSTQKKEVPAPSTNNWECTTFAQDQDGKVAAKFKKLMGIKGASEEKVPASSDEQLRKQEELFRTLDHQYEAARMSTHSFRGVGLGFSSAAPTAILFPK